MCDGMIHYEVEPMKEFYPNLGTSPSKVTWVGVTGGQDALEIKLSVLYRQLVG
jgi:hypothetical protein